MAHPIVHYTPLFPHQKIDQVYNNGGTGGRLSNCERSCRFGKEKGVVQLLGGVTSKEIGGGETKFESALRDQAWGVQILSVSWGDGNYVIFL